MYNLQEIKNHVAGILFNKGMGYKTDMEKYEMIMMYLEPAFSMNASVRDNVLLNSLLNHMSMVICENPSLNTGSLSQVTPEYVVNFAYNYILSFQNSHEHHPEDSIHR